MNREKEKMIETMRAIAAKHHLTKVPRHLFRRESGVSERKLCKLFGSYNALVEAAGLTPTAFPTTDSPTYADGELLAEIARVLRLPDSKLTRIFFEQNAKVSPSVCERRFGGWLSALKKAMDLLDPQTDVDLLSRVRDYTAPSLPIRVSPPQHALPVDTRPKTSGSITTHDIPQISTIPYESTNLYGDFINFRGLQHAPVNEQGVVFLFGMICRELGYVVESIRSSFPDCEAKRQIQGPKGKWQRVRIEFEYESQPSRTMDMIQTNAMS